MRKHELTSHEEAILAAAVKFTAVRGHGRSRTREEFPTLDAARAAAARHGDGRTMIYAISEAGGSAHIENC